MPDLDAIQRAITERCGELERSLEPLVGETELLTCVLRTLEDAPGGTPPPGRPRGGQDRVSSAHGPQRPDRHGQTRAEEALRLIAEHPGTTPAELGRAMAIEPQYLYRILPRLARAGKIVKRGHRYTVAQDAPE